MSFETINNGDTGLVVREKLNEVIENAVDTGHLTDATAHGGVITTHNANASAHSNALNQFLASLYTKFLRFDSIQALTSAQAEQAAHNLMMQGAKNGYTPEQVDNLNPEQNCFGFTKLSTIPGEYFFWIQNYVGAGSSLYTVQTRLNGMYLQRRSRTAGGAWTAWSNISGGGSEVEPYSIAQIPPNPTNAQMEAATGGAGSLRAAIEAGRPVYGYWDTNFKGLVLAANIDTSGNIISLLIPDTNNSTLRLIVWVSGSDPVETIIGGDSFYAIGALSTLTNESTASQINAVIGSFDALKQAIIDGKRIFSLTGAEGNHISYMFNAELVESVEIIALTRILPYGDPNVEAIQYTFDNNSGLTVSVQNIPFGSPVATTSQTGTVTLAANTGNSTDAGKVPVLGSIDGKLNKAVIPDNHIITGTLANNQTHHLTSSGMGSADIYVLSFQAPDQAPAPPTVVFPNSADPRQKIKVQLAMSVTGATYPCVVILQDTAGTSNLQVNPGSTQLTFFIVAEQFEPGKFKITYKANQ